MVSAHKHLNGSHDLATPLSGIACLAICGLALAMIILSTKFGDPAWGQGTPFPPLLLPCPFISSSFALFLLVPFSFSHSLYLFSSIVHPSLSTRIVPIRFKAGGHRRRPNLGLVCFVYYCVICIA